MLLARVPTSSPPTRRPSCPARAEVWWEAVLHHVLDGAQALRVGHAAARQLHAQRAHRLHGVAQPLQQVDERDDLVSLQLQACILKKKRGSEEKHTVCTSCMGSTDGTSTCKSGSV